MKLSKILFGGAVLALSLAFVGCALEEDSENAFSGKSVDFDNKYIIENTDGTIKSAKETDKGAVVNNTYYYRTIKSLKTKHIDSVCTITITPIPTDTYDGVAGYLFNMSKNDDDSYNFAVASARWNGSRVQAYVSWYENAALKENNYTNKSNLVDKNGKMVGEDDAEVEEDQILPASLTFENLDGYEKNAEGKVEIVISVKSATDTGDYTVKFYTIDALGADGKIKANAEAKASTVVKSDVTGRNDPKAQSEIGMYSNIYPGKRFVADWKFTDTNGQAIEIVD